MTTHMHRLRCLGVLALTSAALTMSGCVGWQEAKFRDTRNMSAPYFGTMGLDVQTSNGGIVVRRASGDKIEITADIKAQTQERLDQTFVHADQIDNDLVVRVEWAEGRRLNNEGCAFTIAMPDTESITLRSSNGSLTVESLNGPADLSTSNGRITVTDHMGGVSARTSNGRVTCETIDGAVFADTSNGAVRIVGVSGPVDVDTSNGSVVIELDDDNPGPVRADTSNGSVTLAVGSAFVGTLTADTNNGSIHCEADNISATRMSKDHWRIVFGEGGEASDLESTNGSITVRRLGEASATAG